MDLRQCPGSGECSLRVVGIKGTGTLNVKEIVMVTNTFANIGK